MTWSADRGLVALAIAISTALTALTLWAVARQGNLLHEEKMADLRNSALRVATERVTNLRTEASAAITQAGQALSAESFDGLDQWIVRQTAWPLLFCDSEEGGWTVFPLSPTQRALPLPRTGEFFIVEELELVDHDLLGALARFERLADSEDPLTRARALLAAAACQRKLGRQTSAARAFAEAAAVLRGDPRLSRYAFGAELAAVDSLREAGAESAAWRALEALVENLPALPGTRLDPAELMMLRRRVEAHPPGRPQESLLTALGAVERAARLREAAPSLADELARGFANPSFPSAETVWFFQARTAQGQFIVAVGRAADNRRIALATPLPALIARYWGPPNDNPRWAVALPDEPLLQKPLGSLGAPFGDAQLVPTSEAMESLEYWSARQLLLLVSVAAATAGAWAVVIGMMMRAMERQRELVRLQRRFVADVSHELKTPLALIRLLAETLLEGRVAAPERMRSYHQTITRESERLTLLLDTILDFSRIESGRKQYDLRECDVGAVVRQAWALFEPQFVADRFETRLEVDEALPLTRADAAALNQLLVNLLQNAHRYSTEHRSVRVAVTREGKWIVIAVADRGIGMSRAQARHLGDSFYRAADPRVRRTRGTGLGLAIVKSIVAAHGGKLEVQSRPGAGSTFFVRLPIVAVDAAERATSAEGGPRA